jgi:hypothetical protein
MKDWTRRTSRMHAPPDSSTGERRNQDALQLASLIGSSAIQRIARSRDLRRSPTAAALLSGRPATLARRPREESEISEGFGVGDSMEDWLWQQQGYWEETYRLEEELIKYLETRWSRDDELPREEELRRRGVFHPPPVLGH